MARKEKSNAEQDLSSFMAILIMTIGALVVLLVSNTLVIISNPENTTVTSVVTSSLYGQADGGEGGSPFPMGNRHKEPRYIDVHPDRIYLFPGEIVLPVRELERPGSVLEEFLEEVSQNRQEEYVILLVRPHAGEVFRRLSRAVRDRGIDLGTELFEAGRDVNFEARQAASQRQF